MMGYVLQIALRGSTFVISERQFSLSLSLCNVRARNTLFSPPSGFCFYFSFKASYHRKLLRQHFISLQARCPPVDMLIFIQVHGPPVNHKYTEMLIQLVFVIFKPPKYVWISIFILGHGPPVFRK